jgi:type IV secretory pathway VirB10-like protein
MAEQTKKDPFDLASGVPAMDGSLRPPPRFADRISKRVLGVVFVFLALVFVIFFLALQNMDNKRKAPAQKAVAKTSDTSLTPPDDPDDLFDPGALGKRISLAMPTYKAPENKPIQPESQKGVVVPGIPAATGTGDSSGGVNVPPPLTPEQQAAAQEKLDRMARMAKARLAGLSSKSFGGEDKAGLGLAGPMGGGDAGAASNFLNSAKAALQAQQAGGMAKVASDQDQKLDFLKSAEKNKLEYHQHVPIAALSPNEVKAGRYIPMVLEQSINSDLPGQVTARVSEDVYDSITGCRLLIPAMSNVIGRYDSKVAIGQSRNLVVWNGIIFPDGAELNLAGMQAYDTSGASGLGADVDNHYLRLFGLTLGMSLVTSAVTISVPQPNPGIGGAAAPATSEQLIAASLAQQFGTLGAQILGKYMAVQPTLRNYAGERFIVMVPNTIVFTKVWRNRCQGGTRSTS